MGRVVNVIALDIAGGEVQAIRCVVNPDKPRHLGRGVGTGERCRRTLSRPRLHDPTGPTRPDRISGHPAGRDTPR
jgi:RNA polymerase sigma-70 factor (ECF subfamily)